MSPPPQPGTFDYNDYTKGVTCGPSSGDGQFSAVFYAELTTSLGFVNVNWQRLESEFAGYGSGSSGGGSGGSGS